MTPSLLSSLIVLSYFDHLSSLLKDHPSIEENPRHTERSLHALSTPSRTLSVVGVGNRWILSALRSSSRRSRILKAEVGSSDPLCYWIPFSASCQREKGSTKMKRRGLEIAPVEKSSLLEIKARTDRILSLRPRSPYTGQGIIDPQAAYPKLKSTKTSKK